MDESAIQIFGTAVRGDFLLMFATVIMAAVIAIVQMLLRSREIGSKKGRDTELEVLLSKPEILELIKSEKTTISELVESTRKESASLNRPTNSLIEKIAGDIEWDVAGVIGVGVTVVLLFMVVSGTISKIPEQIFTGWLLILGYYFGKGSKTK